jgi:hypothetical protein
MCDGLSGPVLRDDLARAYSLAVAGGPCALPPPRGDYLAYSRWQVDPARRDERQRHVDVWTERLGARRCSALPVDFRGPATRSLRGSIVTTHLTRESVEALKLLGRRAHVTPFAILLTAFATLMARMSGDPDVVVGIPIAGRPGPEYNDVVGFFATVCAVPRRLRRLAGHAGRALRRSVTASARRSSTATRRWTPSSTVSAACAIRRATRSTASRSACATST